MLKTFAWMCVVVSFIACVSVDPALTEDSRESAGHKRIKIGVTLPLTGNLSNFGESVRNGMLLAKKTHDANDDLELIFEDDGYLPKNTVSALNKFIEQDKVAGVVVFGSGCALAAAPIAEQRKIPMIAFATSPDVVRGRTYVMKHLASVASETRAIQQEVLRRKYDSLAIVSSSQDAMLALRDDFLRDNTVRVVMNEEVPPGETDFKGLATKIASAKPAAVYMLLMPPQGGIFARQIRDVAYPGELFSAHQMEDPREIESSQGALRGAWIVSVNVLADATFPDRYENEFGSKPGNFAVNGYDVAKILVEGAHAPSLIQYLKSVKDFHGVIGTYSATPENDFGLPVLLKTVTEKGFEPIPRS